MNVEEKQISEIEIESNDRNEIKNITKLVLE